MRRGLWRRPTLSVVSLQQHASGSVAFSGSDAIFWPARDDLRRVECVWPSCGAPVVRLGNWRETDDRSPDVVRLSVDGAPFKFCFSS